MIQVITIHVNAANHNYVFEVDGKIVPITKCQVNFDVQGNVPTVQVDMIVKKLEIELEGRVIINILIVPAPKVKELYKQLKEHMGYD